MFPDQRFASVLHYGDSFDFLYPRTHRPILVACCEFRQFETPNKQ